METVETIKKESPESSVDSIGKKGKIVLDVDPPIYYEDDDDDADDDESEKHKLNEAKHANLDIINKYDTRDIDKILIYGFLRLLLDSNSSNEIIDDNANICNLISSFYTKISLLSNCFFVYGTLRDDDYDETEQENIWTQHSDTYLGIVYGFKMYGINGFPAAKMTNNNRDYMIGRIIHFKDDKQFKQKKLWADNIEGFNENKHDEQQFYMRKKIICFIFDQLNQEKLKKMGYYDDEKIIDFSNQSKMKQEAFIYYQKNPEEDGGDSAKETPNSDWIKRYL